MDGNTTNLHAHLKKKQLEEYTTTKIKATKVQPDQTTICDSFLHEQKLSTSGDEHKRLTRNVTY